MLSEKKRGVVKWYTRMHATLHNTSFRLFIISDTWKQKAWFTVYCFILCIKSDERSQKAQRVPWRLWWWQGWPEILQVIMLICILKCFNAFNAFCHYFTLMLIFFFFFFLGAAHCRSVFVTEKRRSSWMNVTGRGRRRSWRKLDKDFSLRVTLILMLNYRE